MTYAYLLVRLVPGYATSRIKLRPSPGDGLKDLPASPLWS
jgi:hypothetical protein